MNPFRHSGKATWTGIPHRKASTYTGQHNTKTWIQIHASRGIQTHDSNVRAGQYKRALDRAATGTGTRLNEGQSPEMYIFSCFLYRQGFTTEK